MNDDRTPVLIGAGQLTQRDIAPAESLGPLEMMAETARGAAADAGAGPALLRAVDSVAVVNVLSWHCGNAPRLLAEQIGAQPSEELYTSVGGNTPQWLVSETAAKITAGRVRLALLAGAEAVCSLRLARRRGVDLPWLSGGQGTPVLVGDARRATTDHEIAHGLQAPALIYPLFETALLARSGRRVAEHRERLGVLCSRLSEIAAKNPYAWFRQARTPATISTASPNNRMVSFPYTKYMNAMMDVDQSAAVLMTSVAGARALGIAEDRWVYLWASAEATDRWFVSERRDYHSAPALRVAGTRALAGAGIVIDEVHYLDLYSCFPSAVQIGRDMLGIADDGARDLTVTGGLPYAGGPGSNYTMHAIATMMAKLRAVPGTIGLVTGLGWYLTKHAVGIYSAERPRQPWCRASTYDDGGERGGEAPSLTREPSGGGAVETCTVVHDRDGAPIRGIVIGRLDDGSRFLANTPAARSALEALMADGAVGLRGRVTTADGVNRLDLL